MNYINYVIALRLAVLFGFITRQSAHEFSFRKLQQ